MFACALAHAAAPVAVTQDTTNAALPEPPAVSQPYVERTDFELTQLAAQWETLDNDQRRALLTEVKHRMATSKAKEPIITIKTRRRYGRTIRRSDGSLVRIETTEQVLRYHRPSGFPSSNTPDDKRAFGVGFERRVADDNEAPSRQPDVPTPPGRTNAPVINVSSDSR